MTVGTEAAHRVVDVAVFGLIGKALFFELADQVEHRRNVFGRARLVRGRKAAEREHVFLHGARKFVRELVGRDAAFGRAADDLVVNVGNVTNEHNFVARRFEPAADHVEGDERAAVADVAVVVDRHAADVHAHAPGFNRFERLLFSGKSRINRKRHDSPASLAATRRPMLDAGSPSGARLTVGATSPVGPQAANPLKSLVEFSKV